MSILVTSIRAIAAAALFSLTVHAGAATDMFLQIEGIPGEATAKEHRDWIDIESFSWGMRSNPSAGPGGGGAGVANFLELQLGKNLDKASPYIFLGGAEGRHFSQVVLVLRKPLGEESFKFFEIKLEDVFISGSTLSGQTSNDRPTETLSLNYGKITWTYHQQAPTGGPGQSISTSWNVATNSRD